MNISVDTKELQDLIGKMKAAEVYAPARKKAVLTAIGLIVNRAAWNYAPMSMSKTQYMATLKGRRGKDGARLPVETKRKVFTRGALKFSITNKVEDDQVSIFVPSNSPAGDYAEKMHDERGKTWNKLSSGKQPNSQDKYIENAEKDTKQVYLKEVDKYVDALISGLTGKAAGLHTR
jgi:hypothetical protein